MNKLREEAVEDFFKELEEKRKKRGELKKRVAFYYL